MKEKTLETQKKKAVKKASSKKKTPSTKTSTVRRNVTKKSMNKKIQPSSKSTQGKKLREEKKNQKEVMEEKYAKVPSTLGITIVGQIIIGILLILFAFIYLFEPKFLAALQILASIFLFIGAYNGHKYFGHQKFTWLYIVAGLMVLSNFIVEIIIHNGK